MLRCMHRGRRNYGRYYSTVGALSHEHCRPSSYSLALSGSVSDAPVSFGVAFQHVLRGNPSEWSHRGRTSDGSGQPEDGWRVPFLSQQLMVYGCSPPFASHTHCRTPLNRPPPPRNHCRNLRHHCRPQLRRVRCAPICWPLTPSLASPLRYLGRKPNTLAPLSPLKCCNTNTGGLPVARALKAHVFPHDRGSRGDLVERYVVPQQDGSYGRGKVRHQVPAEGRYARPDRSEWNGVENLSPYS